jgi:ketol-acid reductoisomerase
MTVIYREPDANLAALSGRRIAVLGYGSQGRAVALNLRDSGLSLVVGTDDATEHEHARAENFDVMLLAEAANISDTVLMLLPSDTLPSAYLNHVSPTIRSGDTLIFASGYTVAFGFIEPPPFVDVVMIAPRIAGELIREKYQSGFLSFVSVVQDHTGKAWERLLAVALAMGTLRAGAVEVSFRQEAEIDLFVEQTLLPALHSLIMTAADVMIKEGYPSEAVLLDLYASGELGNMLSRAAQIGLMQSLGKYSPTRQYGLLSRLERYQDQKLRRQMEMILDDIRNGKFAQEWAGEVANDYLRLEAYRQKQEKTNLWGMEQQLLEDIHPRE